MGMTGDPGAPREKAPLPVREEVAPARPGYDRGRAARAGGRRSAAPVCDWERSEPCLEWLLLLYLQQATRCCCPIPLCLAAVRSGGGHSVTFIAGSSALCRLVLPRDTHNLPAEVEYNVDGKKTQETRNCKVGQG